MATRVGGKGVRWLAVITLAVVIVVAVAVWIDTGGNDSITPEQQPSDEPEPSAELDLPGAPFAASGTVVALPGAPGLPINLWDHPDRSAPVVRVVGQVSPGQSVTITRRYQNIDEDQFYYRIESGGLVGWIPETRLDIERR